MSKVSSKNLEHTSILGKTSSLLGDFSQQKAIFKRGTNQEDTKPNPLTVDQQFSLVLEIFNRCYNVKIDGQKEILLDLYNGRVQHIERNYKNFGTIIKMAFRNVGDNDGFECINLPKLFEVIKSKQVYSFRHSRSIFHEANKLVIDDEKNELISELKINYDFNISDIEQKAYDDIVYGISSHWRGLLPTILNHIVAGKFVSDKKNIWLMIMADSNFGKSKLFKWLEPFGGAGFIKFEDLTSSGISDKSPDEYEGKMCLAIDEVTSFHRKLFEIEDYLMVRPMRNHSIKVPINSRVLLSADGGTFNNEYMDKQIINRVAVVDLRGKDTKDLGTLPIVQKYGRYTIQLVMTHYLYSEIKRRLEEYNNLSHIDRANKADKTISDIFEEHKQDKKDFFEIVEQSLYEILENPKGTLDDRAYESLMSALVTCETNTLDGWIIKRPKDVVEKILVNYDKSLEYEMKYKTIKQLEAKIKGFREAQFKVEGNVVRGLYVPKRRATVKEIQRECKLNGVWKENEVANHREVI